MANNLNNHLLACCKFISRQQNRDSQLNILPQNFLLPQDIPTKDALEKIVSVGKNQGFRTSIYRLPPTDALKLTPVLPVITEMLDHSYWVIEKLFKQQDAEGYTVRAAIPQASGDVKNIDIPIKEFTTQWSGGALRFEKINTALVCFSILARENKIEVTQERLIHEYGLDSEEISKETLLKMGKGHKLRGKCLSLDWQSWRI